MNHPFLRVVRPLMKSIHNTMKFMDDKIEELLVKKVDEELSAKEEEFLSLWLAEDVEHERELQVFMAVRQRLSVLREEFRPDISGRLQLVKSRRKKRVHLGLWLRYVAIWILVAGVGGYLLWRDRESVEREHRMFAQVAVPGNERAYLVWANGERVEINEMMRDTVLTGMGGGIMRVDSNRVLHYESQDSLASRGNRMHKLVVPNGGEYRIVLEDGSVVWLNSASTLEIPEYFETGERRVRLTGEGYFKVKRDTGRPFYVETERLNVRVLGTEFNLSAYKDDLMPSATLINGAVRVIECRGDSVMLKPGQQAVVGKKGLEVQEVDVAYITSWVDGKFHFEDARLEDIALRIARWYDVKISFQQEELKEVRFSGAMLKFRPLGDLIEMIEATSYVRFSVQGDSIVISRR